MAHLVFGSSYRQYYKIVKLALGMPAVVPDTFYHVTELVYKPIEDMLKEQASEALEEMKTIDPKQIGSSKQSSDCRRWHVVTVQVFKKSHFYAA